MGGNLDGRKAIASRTLAEVVAWEIARGYDEEVRYEVVSERAQSRLALPGNDADSPRGRRVIAMSSGLVRWARLLAREFGRVRCSGEVRVV